MAQFANQNMDSLIVKELSEKLGVNLKNYDESGFFGDKPGYCADKQGNVRAINLASCNLGSIPDNLLQLKNLSRINLQDNRITTLDKPWLTNNWRLKMQKDSDENSIYLKGNPLQQPPEEIIRRGQKAIDAYTKALQQREVFRVNEAKVLLVGDGGSGKTSLLNLIRGEDFNHNESQTHGITIESVPLHVENHELKLNFWDFGGQQIMHATHQFFLTHRSLYILVLDGRKEENIEYWLKLIGTFGGNSTILVVINKIDENPGFDLNRRFLSEKYASIKGYFRVSCATGDGFTEFQKGLKQEVGKMDILKIAWANSWLHVKNSLQNNIRDYLEYDEFEKICLKQGVDDATERDTLLILLHDLGVILHFRDWELADTHVLNPKWVTSAVYRIINSKQLAAGNGLLPLNQINTILTQRNNTDFKYPASKQRYIVRLMQKFELGFRWNSDYLLVPDLLTVEEPEIDLKIRLGNNYVLRYDYLPTSVMPRFIVKNQQFIYQKMLWRTGVVLYSSINRQFAVVRTDSDNRQVSIQLSESDNRDFYNVLRHKFYLIHNSYSGLNVSEMIPCNCPACNQSDQPHYYKYAELEKRSKLGKTTIECYNSYENVNISGLLQGLAAPNVVSKPEIESYISNNELDKALELFLTLALNQQSEQLKDSIILLKARFQHNEKEFHSDLINKSDYNRERNRITAALLQLL